MNLKENISRITTSYAFINCLVLFLIITGPVLISVDMTYMTDWIKSFKIGDFYTYLTFIGLISLWSIYGLICTLMSSIGGVTIYMVGLFGVIIVHFIMGIIHIIVLFTKYKPVLMNSCLQRDSSRFFWWSLDYDESYEQKEVYRKCNKLWTRFSRERIISWALYSFISILCLYLIVKYQRKLIKKESMEELEKANNEDNVRSTLCQQRKNILEDIRKRKAKRNSLGSRQSIRSMDEKQLIEKNPEMDDRSSFEPLPYYEDENEYLIQDKKSNQ